MNNRKFTTSLPKSRQAGGLILNVGIGVIFGLLAALLAVYLSTKGGPFKDHANTNTIAPAAGQSSDPNAPLYGAPAQTLDPKAAAAATAAATASGEGLGVLTGNSSITAPAKSATKQTAQAVETPPSDPVGAVINGTSGAKSDSGKPDSNKAGSNAKPETVQPKPAANTTPATESKPKTTAPAQTAAATPAAPKPVKPTTLPKEVRPATAP